MPDIPGKDKTLHVLAYFTAAILILLGFLRRVRFTEILILVLWLLILGIVDEWTQPYFNRTCDFFDWLSDMGGVAAGTAVVVTLCLVKRRALFQY